MKALLVALAIAHGADAGVTCAAIAAGAREGNPLLPSTCGALVGVVATETAGQVWLLAHLARARPTLARRLAVVAFGVESGAAGYSLRVTIDARAGR